MDYLNERQQVELVERLLLLTRTGKLKWVVQEITEYAFTAVTGQYGFVLESKDEDDYHPFELRILSRGEGGKGRGVQELTSGNTSASEALGDLYSQVKRKTLDIERVSLELFQELDRLDAETPIDGGTP